MALASLWGNLVSMAIALDRNVVGGWVAGRDSFDGMENDFFWKVLVTYSRFSRSDKTDQEIVGWRPSHFFDF